MTILDMHLWSVIARILPLLIGVFLLLILLDVSPSRLHKDTRSQDTSPHRPSSPPTSLPPPQLVQLECNKTTVRQPDDDPYNAVYRKLYPKGTDPADANPMIHITSATEFQPGTFQWFPEGSSVFEKCPNLLPWMKCSYSSDGHNMDTIKSAHAVLFHPRHMKKTRPQYKGLPPYRDSQQKWIFYESEVPPNTWNSVDKNYDFWTMFNLTSTITSDSDIPLHHIHMKCKPRENYKPSNKNHTATKTKMAAWFVSHCASSSKREVYADELNKYFDVDIYGACGNTTMCSRHDLNGYDQKQCMFNMVERDYWFYLSFENAFCDEYVTEKFHRMVRNADVIPVVLGSADYANILPRGSYIDIRDFTSVKHLADFLIELTKDPSRYNSYIEKANAYECGFPLDFECTLCEYLHQHRSETQIVFDALSFWSMEQRCQSPKDFYRTCAPEIISNITFGDNYPDLFF